MTLRLKAAAVSLVTLLPLADLAVAAIPTKQTIHTEVVTKGTRLGGERESATSGASVVTAPEGYVIVERQTKTVRTGQNGSSNNVNVTYSDYVEVLPGSNITQPRTVTVSSHARSPKHTRGARGWTKADVTVEFVKYQK